MPNAFAYLVFYSWPLVTYFIFRKQPLVPALVWSMVLGYVLLPSRVGFDFPAFPTIGRYEVIAISAAIMCYLKVRADRRPTPWQTTPEVQDFEIRKTVPPRRSRAIWIARILLSMIIITPVLTVIFNQDPIIAGPRVVPGLRLYDAFSVIGTTIFSLLPFLLGRRFLNTPESHVILLRVLCYTMVGYALLALWEIRMSPQLNRVIYGFVSSSFLQHMRAGGFRPLVFFEHGLSLGIFLSMSVLATTALWRHLKEGAAKSTIWVFFIGWLLFTLVLAKSLGALMITLGLLPFAVLTRVRGQLVLAATVATVVLLYPMLRGAGYVPTDAVYEWVLERNTERAQSLKFRLDNEDSLLTKANERPILGWGSWGRNRIFDEDSGRDLSVTDGIWVITIGTSGWVGYIAQFGLLTIPIMLLSLNRRRLDISIATSGLAIVLSANLIDMLPNAGLTPITWLAAGALMGRFIAACEAALEPRQQAVSPDVPLTTPIPGTQATIKTRTARADVGGRTTGMIADAGLAEPPKDRGKMQRKPRQKKVQTNEQ